MFKLEGSEYPTKFKDEIPERVKTHIEKVLDELKSKLPKHLRYKEPVSLKVRESFNPIPIASSYKSPEENSIREYQLTTSFRNINPIIRDELARLVGHRIAEENVKDKTIPETSHDLVKDAFTSYLMSKNNNIHEHLKYLQDRIKNTKKQLEETGVNRGRSNWLKYYNNQIAHLIPIIDKEGDDKPIDYGFGRRIGE